MTASTEAAAVLGIDTATADVAVAVERADRLLFESRVEARPGERPRHSQVLLEQVGLAVEAASGWDEIGLIAVGLGPGTFTGLRIGIATARALAQARALELVGVSSLAALARGFEAAPGQPRLALIDARRGELFAGLYDAAGNELWEPFVATAKEIAARVRELPESPLAAGDGSLRFREELEAAGAQVPLEADPAHRIEGRQICALASVGERAGPEQARPIYLRRPDAEIWRANQQGGGDG